MEDFEKIKSAVDQAKLQQAEISGQLKQYQSQLNSFGFEGEDIVGQANDYLNAQEEILDQQEENIKQSKQKISDKYQQIIQETARARTEATEDFNLAMHGNAEGIPKVFSDD